LIGPTRGAQSYAKKLHENPAKKYFQKTFVKSAGNSEIIKLLSNMGALEQLMEMGFTKEKS
jgi:hypothetical protein